MEIFSVTISTLPDSASIMANPRRTALAAGGHLLKRSWLCLSSAPLEENPRRTRQKVGVVSPERARPPTARAPRRGQGDATGRRPSPLTARKAAKESPARRRGRGECYTTYRLGGMRDPRSASRLAYRAGPA